MVSDVLLIWECARVSRPHPPPSDLILGIVIAKDRCGGVLSATSQLRDNYGETAKFVGGNRKGPGVAKAAGFSIVVFPCSSPECTLKVSLKSCPFLTRGCLV